MTTTAELVADYTARFSARYLDEHSVGSGVGLWLQLTLVAAATEGGDRARLEAELGIDAEDAAQRAAKLLAGGHPALHAAIALWDRPELVSSAFDGWSTSLPDGVEHGPMPDQAHAKAWAHRHTLGMIPTFPMQIEPDVALLLASALATDVTWENPFIPVDAEQLGGTFGASITVGFRAPGSHPQLLADTDAAGTITEDRAVEPGWDGPIQHVRTTLAAWTASSNHDLGADPGVAVAGAALARFVDDHRGATPLAARQAAVAEFSREGFRATAITAMAAGGSARTRWEEQPRRVAEVRFNRPYAVLAIARGPRDRVSSWTDVPVFSAWVAEVVDTPEPAERRDERRSRSGGVEG